MGITAGEGQLRKTQYNSCFRKNGKFTPLWDLTDDLQKKIEKRYEIEVPEIYNYISRTGCMGCPYGSYKNETSKELDLVTDAQYEFLCELYRESYEVLDVRTQRQHLFKF